MRGTEQSDRETAELLAIVRSAGWAIRQDRNGIIQLVRSRAWMKEQRRVQMERAARAAERRARR